MQATHNTKHSPINLLHPITSPLPNFQSTITTPSDTHNWRPTLCSRQLLASIPGNRCWVRGDRRVSIRSHPNTRTCTGSHRIFSSALIIPRHPPTPPLSFSKWGGCYLLGDVSPRKRRPYSAVLEEKGVGLYKGVPLLPSLSLCVWC